MIHILKLDLAGKIFPKEKRKKGKKEKRKKENLIFYRA
jgi:hypothetical protein